MPLLQPSVLLRYQKLTDFPSMLLRSLSVLETKFFQPFALYLPQKGKDEFKRRILSPQGDSLSLPLWISPLEPKLPDSLSVFPLSYMHKRLAFLITTKNIPSREVSALSEVIYVGNLYRISMEDTLTGLKNRRAFNEISAKTERLSRIALAIIDLDYFKFYNDRYGHDTGDQILKQFARQLKIFGISTSSRLYVFRIGGEEFSVIGMGQPYYNFYSMLSSLKHEIYRSFFHHPSFHLRISISIGIAYRFSAHDNFSSRRASDFACLFSLADKALYESKKNGRNQITLRFIH